jgi:hypothetical protein
VFLKGDSWSARMGGTPFPDQGVSVTLGSQQP